MAENKKATTPEAGAVANKDKVQAGESQTQGATLSETTEATKAIVTEATEVKDLGKDLQKRVQAVFKANAKLEKVFITSDNQIFADQTFAKPHAKSLEDTSLEVILKG